VSLNDVVSLQEDFADLPVGLQTDWPLTAEGEYHVVPRSLGPWWFATISGGWGDRASGNFRVLEENGRHIVAHGQAALQSGPPMLVRGNRFWGDYAFEMEVRPLSFEGNCGLIVRYQNSRCYVAVRITRGQLALLHREHGSEKFLASCGYAFDVDRYYKLRVECVGSQITVFMDGTKMFVGEEPKYALGKVGFFAQIPAYFAAARVTTSAAGNAAFVARQSAWHAEEKALQDALPKPKLWKKIATPGFGTDRNLRFGDLNGDGKLEVVVSQRQDLMHTDYPQLNCLTAMDLDGNVLWQIGEPTTLLPVAMSDNCVQVYDINGDGCDEVIFCKDLAIHIADGKTGRILKSAPNPRAPVSRVNGGRPYERILGDALLICNLTGGPRAQNIITKDRYANVWALDADLNVLWRVECVPGHFPTAYDIDGDGCDEVMAGYAMIDQDGKLLWELPLERHQDAVIVGPFDLDHPDELLVALAAEDDGFVVATAKGEILAQHRMGHMQKVVAANVCHDRPGLEYTTITFWGHPGLVAVFDARGRLLHSFQLTPYASELLPINWTADGREFLFYSGHPTDGGLIDGYGHRCVLLPDDGHPTYCYTALDITGDGRDELVVWDKESIWIYRVDAALPAGKQYRPIRSPGYNESNYKGFYSLPHWE